SSKRRHTISKRDLSSNVCSTDLTCCENSCTGSGRLRLLPMASSTHHRVGLESAPPHQTGNRVGRRHPKELHQQSPGQRDARRLEIGRASCRDSTNHYAETISWIR